MDCFLFALSVRTRRLLSVTHTHSLFLAFVCSSLGSPLGSALVEHSRARAPRCCYKTKQMASPPSSSPFSSMDRADARGVFRLVEACAFFYFTIPSTHTLIPFFTTVWRRQAFEERQSLSRWLVGPLRQASDILPHARHRL